MNDDCDMDKQINTFIEGLGQAINDRLTAERSLNDKSIEAINAKLDLIVSDPNIKKKVDNLSKLLHSLDFDKDGQISDNFLQLKKLAESSYKKSDRALESARKAMNSANTASRRIDALEKGELMSKIACDSQKTLIGELISSLDKFDALINPAKPPFIVD